MSYGNAVTGNPIVNIKVLGVGGAGNNAVNRMIASNIKSAQFVSINTDKQVLLMNKAPTRLQIGEKITKGQGAGSDPDIGRKAAEESRAAIAEVLKDADLVFITAGMGGGTGTGAAPVIAAIAKEMGILTVAIVTKPFQFEGKVRMANAEKGLAMLQKVVDTLVIIPNAKLSKILPKNTSIVQSFMYADDVLRQGIQSISDVIVIPNLINLDFADVKKIMKNRGVAHMAIGRGRGENRTMEAVRLAVASPLLETTIEGATGVLLNVRGGLDLSLSEVEEAAELVSKVVAKECNIIFGAGIDETLGEEVEITVIATGFAQEVSTYNASMGERAYMEAAEVRAQQQTVKPAYADAPFSYDRNAYENFNKRESADTEVSVASSLKADEAAQRLFASVPSPSENPQNKAQTSRISSTQVQTTRDDDDDDVPPFLKRLRKNRF